MASIAVRRSCCDLPARSAASVREAAVDGVQDAIEVG